MTVPGAKSPSMAATARPKSTTGRKRAPARRAPKKEAGRALRIARIEPTPFQRDLSEAHHKKLAGVLDKTGLFLDPLIAITAPKEGFWTPNGRHRLPGG